VKTNNAYKFVSIFLNSGQSSKLKQCGVLIHGRLTVVWNLDILKANRLACAWCVCPGRSDDGGLSNLVYCQCCRQLGDGSE